MRSQTTVDQFQNFMIFLLAMAGRPRSTRYTGKGSGEFMGGQRWAPFEGRCGWEDQGVTPQLQELPKVSAHRAHILPHTRHCHWATSTWPKSWGPWRNSWPSSVAPLPSHESGQAEPKQVCHLAPGTFFHPGPDSPWPGCSESLSSVDGHKQYGRHSPLNDSQSRIPTWSWAFQFWSKKVENK